MAHDEYKFAHDDESAVKHVLRDQYDGQLGGNVDDIIKLKPLEDRIIVDTSEVEWRMSRLLLKDPTLIEDSEIAERAKAEMIRFNPRRHANNGRTDGVMRRASQLVNSSHPLERCRNEACTTLTRAVRSR